MIIFIVVVMEYLNLKLAILLSTLDYNFPTILIRLVHCNHFFIIFLKSLIFLRSFNDNLLLFQIYVYIYNIKHDHTI